MLQQNYFIFQGKKKQKLTFRPTFWVEEALRSETGSAKKLYTLKPLA